MKKFNLLFIGRPSIEKGLADLLKALSSLGNHNWQLSIVGQLPKNVILSKYIYSKRIVTLGTLPNSSIPQIMNSHDIIIVPSHYENFGNVVIEALACGLTIVASETGGIKNIIKDDYNGILFTPKNHKQLASKLEMIFNTPEQIERLNKNALLCSKQYDWEKITNKTLELFSKFL